MEYRSKDSGVGSDSIGSRGKGTKYDMGKKTTSSRGSMELDNILTSYEGPPTAPKDSYKKHDERFVKKISSELL